MNITSVPKELKTIIDSEQVDFMIKAGKNLPNRIILKYLFFGFFGLAMLALGLYPVVKEYFKDFVFHFSKESFLEIYSILNINIEKHLLLFLVVFLAADIGFLLYGVYLFFQKGGYFIGTKTRLIKYRNGKIQLTDWEQFTGNIKVEHKGIFGSIALELRTGKIRDSNSNSVYDNRYVPDIIYITKIENVLSIERKCSARIKENDPTPIVKKDYR